MSSKIRFITRLPAVWLALAVPGWVACAGANDEPDADATNSGAGGTESGESSGGSDANGGSGGSGEAGSGGSGGSSASGGTGATSHGGSGGDAGSGGTGSVPPDTETRHFFLPTPESTNTVAPRVVLDAEGGIHSVYTAYAGGRAFYAYCAPGCTDSEAVQVVEFEVGDSIANAALALTEDGSPRVVLSEFDKVYYASCDDDCTSKGGWTTTPILDHDNEMQVTGAALALDADGNPRLLLHTYLAFLGIGQKPPETWFVACDGDCNEPSSWSVDKIADDIWEYPELAYDASGRAHVFAAQVVFEDGAPVEKLALYSECDSGCDEPGSWQRATVAPLHEDTVVLPSFAMALTDEAGVRLALLAKGDPSDPDARSLIYAECDHDCTEENWKASLISENKAIRNGIDLALEDGAPRIAFTLDYNIGVYECESDCTESAWDLTEVEFANNLPADDIFLFPSCSVGAWFLDSPTLAIGSSGERRIGYRAYDVSGSTTPPLDPTKPRCTTGVDFTWSRITLLPG